MGYVCVCAHAQDKSRFYVEMCEKLLPFQSCYQLDHMTMLESWKEPLVQMSEI